MKWSVVDFFGWVEDGEGRTPPVFTLFGWYWYRNGNWSARYTNGDRLFYIVFGPVVCNRQFVLSVEFPTLWVSKGTV